MRGRNIVASLRTWGRQHALVAEQDAVDGVTRIRGSFRHPNRPPAGCCGAAVRRGGYLRGHCAGNRGLMPIPAAAAQATHTATVNSSIHQGWTATMAGKWQFGIIVGATAWGLALAGDLPGIKDLPDVKEGLWESSTLIHGAMDKPMRSTMCNSNAVSRKMYEDTHRNANTRCKEIHTERNGSVITTESECNIDGKGDPLQIRHHAHGQYRDAPGIAQSRQFSRDRDRHEMGGRVPGRHEARDVTGPDGKVIFNAMTQ